MTDPTPEPERNGELIETDDGQAVRFERRLPHDPERVWRAITDSEELKAWFPADIVGDLGSAGAELSFPFRNDEGPTEPGEVLESDAPRVLAYKWGEQTLRFELEPDGDGTRMTFTHELPRDEAAKTAAGWEICLTDLESSLAGADSEGFDEERWNELHEGYAEEFGVSTEAGRKEIAEMKEAGKLPG